MMILCMGVEVFAHDEGHGPKLTDSPKQGGVIAPVVPKKEASKGSKATLVYKAELVRSDDGTIRLYLYDKQMNALDLAKFDKSANGILVLTKKKKTTTTKFPLTLDGDNFTGKAPAASSKPFNIDVHLKEGKTELLTAFDNLD
jgi:hypothetical protein